MARLQDVVVDCRHPASLARFWAALLEGYTVAPYDQAELERLRGLGVDSPEDDPTVLGEARVRRRAPVLVPAGPRAKVTKNRVHLDLRCEDVDAEVARAQQLGGRVLAAHSDHVVLADPEGNELCLLP